MSNAFPGQDVTLPDFINPGPLAELMRVICDLGKYSHIELLYNPDAFLQHVTRLVAECIDTVQASHKEITPETQDLFTDRCYMVTNLVAVVKHSPQLKRYPGGLHQQVKEKLDYLCLTFHRLLFRFFSADYQLPDSYIRMEINNAETQYFRLKKQYSGNHLLNAMLRPIYKFIHNTAAEQHTKARIEYINTLLHNLKLWSRKEGTSAQLYEIALIMNLNCPRFMHYMANEANTHIHSGERSADRLERIAQLRKQYLHALTSTRWQPCAYGAYRPDAISIVTHIDEWLKRQFDLVSEEMKTPMDELVRAELKEDGLFFSIFMRITVTVGLFKLKKFAPVLRIFGRVISFPRSETPSSANLITLASNRASGAVLDKLESFFEECLLLVRKIRRNGGKFPDDTDREE